MAEVNLGRIGFVNKQNWQKNTQYKLNDIVKHNGAIYSCISPHVSSNFDTTKFQEWINADKYSKQEVDNKITSLCIHKTLSLTQSFTQNGETTYHNKPVKIGKISTLKSDFQVLYLYLTGDINYPYTAINLIMNLHTYQQKMISIKVNNLSDKSISFALTKQFELFALPFGEWRGAIELSTSKEGIFESFFCESVGTYTNAGWTNVPEEVMPPEGKSWEYTFTCPPKQIIQRRFAKQAILAASLQNA